MNHTIYKGYRIRYADGGAYLADSTKIEVFVAGNFVQDYTPTSLDAIVNAHLHDVADINRVFEEMAVINPDMEVIGEDDPRYPEVQRILESHTVVPLRPDVDQSEHELYHAETYLERWLHDRADDAEWQKPDLKSL